MPPKGKKVGLYFSASWCIPCLHFTPCLVEAYNDLSSKNVGFELVFVSAEDRVKSFNGYFSMMPWLAIPFDDFETRDRLDQLFEVRDMPYLFFTDVAVEIIREYGVESYPFTPDRIKELKYEEEEVIKAQNVRSIVASYSCDYVISSNGENVSIVIFIFLLLSRSLKEKTVYLYFYFSSYRNCADFTPSLIEFYEKLKTKGECFEVVSIPLDVNKDSFQKGGIPWYTLPLEDRRCKKLARHFKIATLPTVVIIGPDGKTLQQNVAETIEDYGIEGYPFTPEKFKELEELRKAKEEAQTLESVLVAGDLDYVINTSGAKIAVSDLVGMSILIYFSPSWCIPCCAFIPMLIEVYHEIKEEDEALEVIFITSDKDQECFDGFFATMPWLALPLERLKEIEAGFVEMAKEWPEKLNHSFHEEHELELKRREWYICDGCEDDGRVWAFRCDKCNFNLHPNCALEDDSNEHGNEDGWINLNLPLGFFHTSALSREMLSL
ncbi:hypothetical protein V2J09_013093 [Rumex salicifolius]